jgi:hypothetical protein
MLYSLHIKSSLKNIKKISFGGTWSLGLHGSKRAEVRKWDSWRNGSWAGIANRNQRRDETPDGPTEALAIPG